jgi:hypothetical protein
MSKTPAFLITLALLALVTGAVVFDLSRGEDVSGGFLRPSRRSASAQAPAIEPRPPIPITLDGVSLHPDAPLPAGAARLVARTITVTLSTNKFHDIQDAIAKYVAAHHASIVGEEGLPGRVLMVTLTVPPADAEAARAGVWALGTVLHEVPTAEDITDNHRALLSRIEAARAEDRRLTDLLAGGANSVADAAGVTRAQTFARAEASRLASEAAALAARAAVVTLVLKIESR